MNVSPMMQQYHQAKAAAGDALLLFRMGDFYELFFEDAKTAARALGLTLTSRDKGENPVAMAGFPHHQLEGYLAKLIAQGFRVAICDQVEDPKQAKGIVKREVTRVVTPGTLTDDGLLDPRESNYLAAVVLEDSKAGRPSRAGLAWVEVSTGRFHACVCKPERLADELARVAPSECLVPDDGPPPGEVLQSGVMFTKRPPFAFALSKASASAMTMARRFGPRARSSIIWSKPRRPRWPISIVCCPISAAAVWRLIRRRVAASKSPARCAAAAKAHCWLCSIAASRRWARASLPSGSPAR
jgi:DNA mismatch repair protein MutS